MNLIKFMAANVDDNICTLYRENTFYRIGMMLSNKNETFSSDKISRNIVPDNELLRAAEVNLLPYKQVENKTFTSMSQYIHLQCWYNLLTVMEL